MQPHASIPHQKSHPNQAGVKPGPGTDHLQKVAGFMTKHGIAGLPRNYHLVHEALHGHNAGLARDLAALAQRPTQHALDQLGLKHRLASHCWLAEERLQSESAALLHNLGDHLGLGILHKQTFARALETITRSIREDETRGIGELIAELDFLAAAAADLLQAETELAVKLKNGLQQIEAADRVAEAAKVMKAKDGLTGLPNRLAFMNRLGELFAEDVPAPATALVLIDVDNFRSINLQFGEEAGNRLLKRMAAIFRKTIKKNDFVARIDGDDFAFLFSDVSGEDAYAIAERLHGAVENNLVFATEHGSQHGGLGLSIGIALSHDADAPMELLAQAQASLGVARSNPRQPIAVFVPERGRAGGRHVA